MFPWTRMVLFTSHENQTEAAFNPWVFLLWNLFTHFGLYIFWADLQTYLKAGNLTSKLCLRRQQCQMVYGEHSNTPRSPPRAPATTIFQIPSRFIISPVVVILKGGMLSRGQAIIQSEIIPVMSWKNQGPGDQVEK